MTGTHLASFVKIPLSNGKVALVSPEDAEGVTRHSWWASRHGRSWRAKGRVDGEHVQLHRFILNLDPGDPHVDHKNGNPLDCRRGNLREASVSQNQSNRRKQGKLPYRGIEKNRRRWRAKIDFQRKVYRIGSFETAEEAAHAYDEAARRLYGEFACVNFPREGERRAL